MRIVVCENKVTDLFVSALSEIKIRELGSQYDIVIVEYRDSEIQVGPDECWSRVFMTDPKKLELVQAFVGITYKNLQNLKENGLQGGFEIDIDAKGITNILKPLSTKIDFYDGPSGHYL